MKNEIEMEERKDGWKLGNKAGSVPLENII